VLGAILRHLIGELVVHVFTNTLSNFLGHLVDGTDNFLRKIPFCAISIARLGDTPEDSFAIVHNPITNHTFSSFMHGGAYENEHVTNLTAEPLGGRFTITIGRGRAPWMAPAGHAITAGCAAKFGRCLAYGSTALELAYVSAGRIDGFLTFGLASYDYAAGLYLVRAAGGAISVFEDNAWHIWEGSIKELCSQHRRTIFVSHPDVHESVRDFIGDPARWSSTG
jgi:myo-inositol-1(or 4)-monophosphatase